MKYYQCFIHASNPNTRPDHSTPCASHLQIKPLTTSDSFPRSYIIIVKLPSFLSTYCTSEATGEKTEQSTAYEAASTHNIRIFDKTRVNLGLAASFQPYRRTMRHATQLDQCVDKGPPHQNPVMTSPISRPEPH
ncbi:uncharacterized protein ACNLHF_007330 isoform 2-T2 [Anomaloglossus baeobatrachus]